MEATETPTAERAVKERYVELSYRLPDVELVQFYAAVVIDSPSPRDALARAQATLLRAHPEATEVEEFMQRVLTDAQAADILAAISAGTWEGWSFGS